MRVLFVGLGGVGSRLAPLIAQYLAYQEGSYNLVLVDGDNFEPSNGNRQVFTELGNKAEVVASQIRQSHPNLTIETKTKFITDDNVFVYLREGDFVFCCVDNHASRRTLSKHCATLQNVVLLSGGNDYDDGNIQVFIRRHGENVTPPLTYLHSEIEDPKDKNPAELSCEERAATGSPQLVFANFTVTALLANAFYVVTKGDITYSEVYFDLKTGAQRPILRKECK